MGNTYDLAELKIEVPSGTRTFEQTGKKVELWVKNYQIHDDLVCFTLGKGYQAERIEQVEDKYYLICELKN